MIILKSNVRLGFESEPQETNEIPCMLGIDQSDFRLVLGRSSIDYDSDKEDINRKKHGYSLESAIDLLNRLLLPIPTPPFIVSEPLYVGDEIRHQHIGIDDAGNVVFMVTTMRPDEVIRVISFRQASKKEREIFYLLTTNDKHL